jgi:Aph-1 protein
MGVLLFWGCIFLAYSPAATLLLGYVSRRSALLILSIIAAFLWLLAIFASSIIWIIIPPLKQVHGWTSTITTIIEEAARYGMILLYVRTEDQADKLKRGNSPKLFNDCAGAISMGVGYGLMQTVMMYGGIIASSVGEAAFYLPTCSQFSVYTLSAVNALYYNILNITFTIILLDGYRRQRKLNLVFPVILHLAFGYISLSNNSVNNGCVASISVNAILVLISVAWAVYIVIRPDYAAAAQIMAWKNSMVASRQARHTRIGAAIE